MPIATYYKAATKTTTTVSHITYFLTDNHKPQSPNSRNNGAVESRWQKVRIRIHLNTWEPNEAKKCCPTLWSTYREVDIGNWWSSCHKNLDNLCMSCPCCQVKWAGTLVVGAITRGFVAKQQLHDVSGIQKKKEWLKKELLDPNFFSSLWNSNTNASCIFSFDGFWSWKRSCSSILKKFFSSCSNSVLTWSERPSWASVTVWQLYIGKCMIMIYLQVSVKSCIMQCRVSAAISAVAATRTSPQAAMEKVLQLDASFLHCLHSISEIATPAMI